MLVNGQTEPTEVIGSTLLASYVAVTPSSLRIQVRNSDGTLSNSVTLVANSGSAPSGDSGSSGSNGNNNNPSGSSSSSSNNKSGSSSNSGGSSSPSSPVVSVPVPVSPVLVAGSTYFVRPDGGTRYSTNVTSGQCNGLADAAYPGVGVNQNCAFNDVRYFWQDGSYDNGSFPSYGWIGKGGDAYLIRGSLGTGVSYRIGWNNPSTATNANGSYWGIPGDPYDSGIPVPPSGTAAQPTRILGENYAACTTAAAKTQLHGGYGVFNVLDLRGTANVDVECLDITDFSGCTMGNAANPCNTDAIGSLSDAARTAIVWNNSAINDTLENINIHGMSASGMTGPTGNGTVLTNVSLLGNGISGWNADAGDGTTGKGTLLVEGFNISWNGCAEEYPLSHALPYAFCSDDNSGGYGDGFGTASVQTAAPWTVRFDNGTVSYNTQDGLDSLHVYGPGTSVTYSRVLAFGNMGQQLKAGGSPSSMINNVIVSNCNALREDIPGTPAGYNARLSDFCRAADTAIDLPVGPNATSVFAFNTVYSASATTLEIDCQATEVCDSTAKVDYENNIFVGFLNSTANGYPSSWPVTNDYANPVFYSTPTNPLTNPGSVFSNNLTFHPKSNWTCPAQGEKNALCVDPELTNQTWPLYGYDNVTPLATSPVLGKALSLPNITTDLLGNTRTATPAIGAFQ